MYSFLQCLKCLFSKTVRVGTLNILSGWSKVPSILVASGLIFARTIIIITCMRQCPSWWPVSLHHLQKVIFGQFSSVPVTSGSWSQQPCKSETRFLPSWPIIYIYNCDVKMLSGNTWISPNDDGLMFSWNFFIHCLLQNEMIHNVVLTQGTNTLLP